MLTEIEIETNCRALSVLIENQGDLNREGVLSFYRHLLEASNSQNLTKLLSPEDFFEGHLADVIELKRSNLIKPDANFIDIGSGCGVPGLLYAAAYCEPFQKMVLSESEVRKAEFLEATTKAMGLTRVSVDYGRAEKFLKATKAEYVVLARAVSSIEKLFALLRNCSTWNTLVLFKSVKWADEIAALPKNTIELISKHDYESPIQKKFRTILKLKRIKK